MTVSHFSAAVFIFIFQLIDFFFCWMGRFVLFCVQAQSLFCILSLYVLRPTQKILTFASCVFSALYLFLVVCFIYSWGFTLVSEFLRSFTGALCGRCHKEFLIFVSLSFQVLVFPAVRSTFCWILDLLKLMVEDVW